MNRTRFLILLILLAAAFYRLHRLPGLPPGLNFDEAGNGAAVRDILQGEPKIWWRIGGGKEPLWPYLVTLSILLLDYIPLALRLLAALTGILTVAAVYPLALRLFHPHRAGLFALLALTFVAFSEWHLHFSRLGFRAILLPLLSTLAFYFLLRIPYSVFRINQYAIRNTQYVFPSLFLALAIYAYLAARLLPGVVLLFLLLSILLHYFQGGRRAGYALLAVAKPYLGIALGLFLPLLLFLLPLIIYFSYNPADFVARSTTVSIFNPAWNQGDLLGALWETLRLTLGTFLGLAGDPNPLVNLPGRPALPVWLAVLFIIGVGTCFYHLIKPSLAKPDEQFIKAEQYSPPSPRFNPYLFLLCWWSVMLLPALLAPEGAPHHLRLIGALIPTYLLVALGLHTAVLCIAYYVSTNTRHATRNTFHISRFAFYVSRSTFHATHLTQHVPRFTFYAFLSLLALQTYHHYFIRWPASTDFTLPFDLYAVRLAGEIAQAPPEVAYILPVDIRAGAEARHYTLDYLLAPVRSPAYTYIPVDEVNAETLLAQASAGKTELRVVRWTADKHHEADAKELVTYLLETSAQPVGRESFPVYDLETYQLQQKSPSSQMNFDLPAIDRPVKANFDGLLSLEAAYVPATAQAGSWLPVALTLAPLAPMEIDYKASLRLVGPGGERLAQKDRTLLHNFHQGTSLWPPETVNEYYLLPVPPDAPPGDYQVVAVIYHPDTLSPLIANGQAEVSLGAVQIK